MELWHRLRQLPQRIAQFLTYPFSQSSAFVYYVAQRFMWDSCFQKAAALTYTTLLSLVPLLAVVFSLLAAFPVFQSFSSTIEDFIFNSLVPASQEELKSYLVEFAKKAANLTVVGVASLIVTSLLLIETIDHAFNDIWQTRQRRKLMAGFLVYWAILTLGPLLIGMSLGLTTELVSSWTFFSTLNTLLGVEPFLLPLVLLTLAFTLLYVLVPNRYVPISHAAIGAGFAAALFLVAKHGFAFYVTHFPTYELIYGTLAVIPIFLIWLYLSWLIILLGAEITHALTSFHHQDQPHEAELPKQAFIYSFRLVGHLWEAQKAGKTLTLTELARLEPTLSDYRLEQILEHFIQSHWIHRTDDSRYALTVDVHSRNLLDLYQVLPDMLPLQTAGYGWDKNLNSVLGKANRALQETLEVRLTTLYRKDL